ncbi:MAG: hypothetical protein R2772_00685 [Chitinophagales bacterium]
MYWASTPIWFRPYYLRVTDRFAANNLNPPFESGPSILSKGKEGVDLDELEAELVGRMRIARKFKPSLETIIFSFKQDQLANRSFRSSFSFIYVAGFVIGIFPTYCWCLWCCQYYVRFS